MPDLFRFSLTAGARPGAGMQHGPLTGRRDDAAPSRYRVTGFDSSGSNLFSRVVEAMGPDHAKIVALVELRKSFADAHLADQAERLEVAADLTKIRVLEAAFCI
jgi:hypothetical protein